MKILVQPHSVVDIITNSSTEIFVGQRGHSEELVRSIVNQVCKTFHRDFEDMEGSVYTGTRSDYLWREGDNKVDEQVVVIEANQHLIPYGVGDLLRDIFETGVDDDDNN